MPTYEYRCKGCGADLEIVQSFTDDPLTTCEACGGELRKVFGSVGISFKGSGFYKTDSRSGGGSKKSSSNGDAGGSGDKASTDKASTDKGSSDKGSSDKASSAKGGSSSGDKAAASTTTP